MHSLVLVRCPKLLELYTQIRVASRGYQRRRRRCHPCNTNNNRPAAMEGQVLALLEAVSSVVLYNTQAVVSRLDVEALSM